MKKTIAIFIVFLSPLLTHADDGAETKCVYNFYQAPLFTVLFTSYPDGTISNMATIQSPGTESTESLTQVEALAGEKLHAWLSKEQPENAIEIIIYETTQPDGFNSKMINDKSPMGKELPGVCTTAAQ